MSPSTESTTAQPPGRQAVLTAVYGGHAERLDETFTSFAVNPFLELHAFVFGERLPERQVAGIQYHLVKPDGTFSQPYREVNYRRWEVMDELGTDHVLVVDALDVLCLQPMPSLPEVLKGLPMAAAVEHGGGRFMFGPQYTNAYLNAGVSFWDVRASATIRAQILARGRTRFRSRTDDQLSFNEVLHHHYEQLRLLTHHFNCRGLLERRVRGWPYLRSLDGVYIYHTDDAKIARTMLPVKARTELPGLEPDHGPLTRWQQFWRTVGNRFRPHQIR
ncbi:MAG: hypothetical protein H7A46_10035 [Verrucomicrobiales bacterium]|nr:hypothetical protein [Verrucomicrobiales bacterium]